MRILKAILIVALGLGVASVFASAVSAADQTSNQLIVKEANMDENFASQTTGQNESGNITRMDLKVATKSDEVVNVENSTILEPNKDITDIASLKDANLNGLQSGNSRELTTGEIKSIKAQGWADDLWNTGKALLNKITEPFRFAMGGNNSDVEYYPNGKVKRNVTSSWGANLTIPKIPI